MDWATIREILEAVGFFLGGGWLISLYKAKPEKNNLEIENVQKAMEVQAALIKDLDGRIKTLTHDVANLQHRVDLKHEVIYSAYGCKLLRVPEDCVVISEYHKKCAACANGELVTNDE